MQGSDHFVDIIKKQLKAQKVTYKLLAQKMDLSESSVKRLLSSKGLSLQRIEQICSLLGLSFTELCRLAGQHEDANVWHLSLEQEKIFAKDVRLLNIYMFLHAGKRPREILKKFIIDEVEMEKHLLKLDRLGVIEYRDLDHLKVKREGRLRFRRDGAIGRAFFQHTKDNYLKSNFDQDHEFIRFSLIRMNKTLENKLRKKLEEILLEYQEESRYIDDDDKQSMEMGVLLSFRPWHFDKFELIKKR